MDGFTVHEYGHFQHVRPAYDEAGTIQGYGVVPEITIQLSQCDVVWLPSGDVWTQPPRLRNRNCFRSPG